MAVKTLGYFWDRLKFGLRSDVCSLCHTAPLSQPQQLICPACERRITLRQPVPILGFENGALYAACGFPYRVKKMLYDLKFQNQTQNALPLSEILIHYWQKLPQVTGKGWIVVPIPSHKRSKTAHLSYFARPFASHFGFDYCEEGLIWERTILPQHTVLSKRKRKENIEGALQVNPELLRRLKPQSKILIIDDLLTTGSTMTEAHAAFQRKEFTGAVSGLAVTHVPFAISRSHADAP